MYAHEVMDYLSKRKNNIFMNNLSETLIPLLKDSVKFHLGDGSHYISILDKGNYKLQFMEGIHMPYPIVWFDWVNSKKATKWGALCIQCSSTVLHVIPFGFGKDTGWAFTNVIFFILQGGFTEDNIKAITGVYPSADTEEMRRKRGTVDEGTIIMPFYLDGTENEEVANIVTGIVIGIIDVAVTLLTCKNVQEVPVPPPVKLNKKRIKNNKVPIFMHKVLTVVMPKKMRDNVRSNTDLVVGAMPLHLRIGHFKVYTKERPLFGKCVGKFWWPPRPRGDKKNGVIEKQYNVIHT